MGDGSFARSLISIGSLGCVDDDAMLAFGSEVIGALEASARGLMVDLGPGENDDALLTVKGWQSALTSVAAKSGNAAFDPRGVDGIVGPNTRRATVAYQAARGLATDGIVGPNTRNAMRRDLGLPPFGVTPAPIVIAPDVLPSITPNVIPNIFPSGPVVVPPIVPTPTGNDKPAPAPKPAPASGNFLDSVKSAVSEHPYLYGGAAVLAVGAVALAMKGRKRKGKR